MRNRLRGHERGHQVNPSNLYPARFLTVDRGRSDPVPQPAMPIVRGATAIIAATTTQKSADPPKRRGRSERFCRRSTLVAIEKDCVAHRLPPVAAPTREAWCSSRTTVKKTMLAISAGLDASSAHRGKLPAGAGQHRPGFDGVTRACSFSSDRAERSSWRPASYRRSPARCRLHHRR